MNGCCAAKISSFCVANLGNSLAITCNLRLESENADSHIIPLRINQRLLRFLIVLLILLVSLTANAAETISLTENEARIIGNKIWHNEGGGKIENLTVWNKGEAFPSFGIGHFIWYPASVEGPFTESFPQLLAHLSQTTRLPRWLEKIGDAPWQSRAAFYSDIDSPRMKSLRNLMHDTLPQQTRFIIQRMAAALPKILQSLPDQQQRDKVEAQFYRVARQPNGIYALIDYINFKGEGINVTERYKGQGWGLLQVLETMHPENDGVMAEFVRAADLVLTRRVANASRDESRWLPGWRHRLKTYLDT